jgi:hypothetical protein
VGLSFKFFKFKWQFLKDELTRNKVTSRRFRVGNRTPVMSIKCGQDVELKKRF